VDAALVAQSDGRAYLARLLQWHQLADALKIQLRAAVEAGI
jgi:hypothetical protein